MHPTASDCEIMSKVDGTLSCLPIAGFQTEFGGVDPSSLASAYLINLNFGVKTCPFSVKVCAVIWEATNWEQRLKLKNKNIYLGFWKYK